MSLILALTVCSLLFIATATATPSSGEIEGVARLLQMFNPQYVVLQLLWFGIGLACLIIMQFFDYHVYGEFAKLTYVIVVGMLVALLVLNVATRGTVGWFKFGERAFQPAELAKIVLILLVSKIAGEALDKDGGVKRFSDIIKLVAFVGIPTALVMIQPDWGTAFVYICIFIGILFVAKISYKVLIGTALVGAVALPAAYFLVMAEWQQKRIQSFLGITNDALGADYNVAQSKLAIGSGRLLGKGFFAEGSLVQLDFLPEKQTDFIFSSGVEAVGFIGGVIVILLYFTLLIRTLYIAIKAKDHFGSLIVVGVLVMVFAHIFENIGMVMGMMPVTGIPLPFLSYGGSSMLTNMIAYGLVINVSMRRSQKRFNKKNTLAF